ncbi:hypothetical protein D3C71_2123390 [compost metagenome]
MASGITDIPFDVGTRPAVAYRHHVVQRFVGKVSPEVKTVDVMACRFIRERNREMAFQASCPKKRRIDNLRAVRRTDYDNAFM